MRLEGPACAVGWRVIGADHPSLAGHFPGRPLVPGVVLLESVLQVLHEWLAPDARVTGLPAVKFMQPVRPDEPFAIGVERTSSSQARFICRCDGNLVASGSVTLQ